jgi:ElaA protein
MATEALSFTTHKFYELEVDALYTMLQLRTEVFAVEQQCIFNDLDGKDRSALHVLGRDAAGHIVATARILPPQDGHPAHIGRVTTALSHRGGGHGKALMLHALQATRTAYPGAVEINAQSRLERFYAGFGFVVTGAQFLEDGILHTPMLLAAAA